MPFSGDSGSAGNPIPPGNLPFLYVALPVLDEGDHLPATLACLEQQEYQRFRVYICVNQPDEWWNDPVRYSVCLRNRTTLHYLENYRGCNVTIIDRSSPGLGWKGKQKGVGFARRTLMESIAQTADPGDVIVSLDADTTFTHRYLGAVAEHFSPPGCQTALAVPYYHKLTGNREADLAILRYEIYMRHYFLSLFRIGSPYAFTALGSAMAVPVRAYRAIGGMTPKLSGEDFYFLQKLRKYGPVDLWLHEQVFPAARFSDRVFFGTGPAMIRGAAGDWSGYPVYADELFEMLHETYRKIPEFHVRTVPGPVTGFLSDVFGETDPFRPLRENHPDPKRFVRAFHEKLDGLRILQFLKSNNESIGRSDEENLCDFFGKYHPDACGPLKIMQRDGFTFSAASVAELSELRDFLYDKEMVARSTAVPS